MRKKSLTGAIVLIQAVGGWGCGSLVRDTTRDALDIVREDKNAHQQEADAAARQTASQVTQGSLDAMTGRAPPPPVPLAALGAPGGLGTGGSGWGEVTGGSGLAPRGSVPLLASQLAQGLSSELGRQLGEDGTGPLARSMSAAAGQVASSMIQQSRNELEALFPECAGMDGATSRQCQEARLARLSESIGGGVARGMFQAAQPVLLVLAFGGGLTLGLLVFLALSVARLRREPGAEGGVPRRHRPA